MKKMLEYNAYLLDENGGKKDSEELLERLKGLSEAERQAILNALLQNQVSSNEKVKTDIK